MHCIKAQLNTHLIIFIDDFSQKEHQAAILPTEETFSKCI